MEFQEFSEILRDETRKAVNAAQIMAAIELQNAQDDLTLVSNAIVNASITQSVAAVMAALAKAGLFSDGFQSKD